MLPVPTLADLSTFTGRPAATFAAFADQALAQATLMFTIVTRRSELPEDPDLAQLAVNAILELADRILLEQPYVEYLAAPFQTETVMSYSYSRVTPTITKIGQGKLSGLWWWDLAVDQLSMPGSSVLAHGSIDVLPDGLHRKAAGGWEVRNAADEEGSGPPYIRIS